MSYITLNAWSGMWNFCSVLGHGSRYLALDYLISFPKSNLHASASFSNKYSLVNLSLSLTHTQTNDLNNLFLLTFCGSF